ncbi:RING finger protein 227 [Clarias gariepinus]|uniref:E3 ubiquitin-protein ligase-like n=1 Tax=Clarias gariepinus TaxID=13013 RepID=UPI00234D00DD|nr:E3 ubiquitin-protein ligase-like [Clarias gariepinus]
MLSELECGICFRLFDAGRRCPRQLDCKHSFCETCLLTLAGCRSEEPESGSRIICAFCRHSTPLSLSEDTLKGILPVDEDILVRLEEEGVLCESASDREDDDEEPRPETVSQSKDDLPRTQRGRLWKSVKSLYKRIKGSNRQGCITNSEMTDLALMACYMM